MDDQLKKGLYEQVVNVKTRNQLAKLDSKDYSLTSIDKTSAPKILSKYIESIVRKTLESKKTLSEQIDCANKLIDQMSESDDDIKLDLIENESKTLEEVKDHNSPMQSLNIDRPFTSLSSSYLFTGSNGFSLGIELQREIKTSDEICMLISFIKRTGLVMIEDSLKLFAARGGKLKLICTTYTGATEAEAVNDIAKLPGAEVKVSYDTKHTRLHAKSYIFKRNSGFNTAYVGSSNLSRTAVTDGREWNMKITSHDQKDVYDKMCVVFNSYWNSDEYERYTVEDYERLRGAIARERGKGDDYTSFMPDIRLYPFQEAILDKLEVERNLFNHNRNLVVAATGTGKTVISAFDYRRWCEKNVGKPNTLLFVAHREEILKQSRDCFRVVLRDKTFGSLYVGGRKPDQLSHLFASIQTLDSKNNIEAFRQDSFDFIIVDEFHHAAADSYQRLLNYFSPKVLLGLTATPERADKKQILKYFSGEKISAEIRLPEAIERELLVPFHYFGVKDNADFNKLKWTRGGYLDSDLEKEFVLNLEAAKKRAEMIISSINIYAGNPNDIKCIGFCVSVKHAEFMASFFSSKGLRAISVTGDSDDKEREEAKGKLVSGEVNFIFTVDLYNEGVDIPEIDTIMLLRPTNSLTVFLQQLGRGLRTCSDKEFLTVLDFIGQYNKKYNFKDKFKALLANCQRSIIDEIKNGFVSVPSGCFIQLEEGVEKIVLENIRSAIGNKKGIIEDIINFEKDAGKPLSLSSFLDFYHLAPEEIYRYGSFSSLLLQAGKKEFNTSSLLEKSMLRISQIDSPYWLHFLISCLKDEHLVKRVFDSQEKSLLNMLLFTVFPNKPDVSGEENIITIHDSGYRDELLELFQYKLNKQDIITERIRNTPFEVFSKYTRNQILSALGYKDPSSMREGVKYFEKEQIDVFFVTLNKSEKKFSPSTMYKDYIISPELFHWESQNSTSPDSPTGKRYINGKSTVLLFVREREDDNWGTSPYTFLGPVEYESHSGSKPMAIIWRMKYKIPAKFIEEMSLGVAI